jgi:hypothetical protein
MIKIGEKKQEKKKIFRCTGYGSDEKNQGTLETNANKKFKQ